MSDRPENPTSGSWHTPEKDDTKGAAPWYQPDNALTATQVSDLKAQADAPADEDVEIGGTPVAPGTWYRPNTLPEQASEPVLEEAPLEPEPVVPDFAISAARLEAFEMPPDPGIFDGTRSGMLQGIQPDLGKFDDSRSGVVPGIGAEPKPEPTPEPEPDLGQFDASKSGAVPGIGAKEPDLGKFDDTRSGAIPGFGAAAAVDASKSGALPGIGAAGATELSKETGAVPAQAAQPDKFADVEQKVDVLRRQFMEGRLTREQLQDELRRLMILDDAGRWWMLGLETNKWYRYDGRSWVPEEPPRPTPAGAAPATQTGPIVPAVATGGAAAPGAIQGLAAAPQPFNPAGGETPLPNRVPVDDLGATVVGRAAMLDEHRSFEAPTQQGLQAAYSSTLDDTVPGASIAADGTYDPAYDQGGIPPVEGEKGGYIPPKMIGIQPDYSEAFGGYFDRNNMGRLALRLMIFGTVAGLLLAFLVVGGTLLYYFSVVNAYSDDIDQLGQRAGDFQTTIIYDIDGNELAQFNDPRTGARQSVPLNEISPFLIHATLSTEDETFYENPGFSVYGITRAIIVNLRTGGGGGGASTITQQLARALVLDPQFASQRTGNRKLQEIIIASEISRRLSKNKILEIYLNEIYYGNLAYGIEAASQVYFNKPAADLDMAEAAFLAGLPQSPAIYDPVINRPGAVARMDQVMRLMTEANGTGCIQMQHEPYNLEPFCVTAAQLESDYVVQIAQVQIKTFNPPTFDAKYPHFVNYAWGELEEMYGQAIYGSGFQVYTTLDPSVQDAAQSAVLLELSRTPNANNGSVVAVRPRDGAVIAMVGSADFNSDGLSDFNNAPIDGLVNVAFTAQQPGSTIKPFVYLGTMQGNDAGAYWYPGTVIWDVPSQWGNFQPLNYSRTFSGPVSMRFAIGNSLNIPAVKGLAFTDFPRFEAVLQTFGVRTPLQSPSVAGLPSSIGAAEVYPFDMAVAYAALASNGVRQTPYAIARVLNRDGEEIFTADTAPAGLQVIEPQYAYMMTDILSDEAARYRGSGIDIPGWEVAAKTGTTNDVRDVWIVGYSTEAAVAVWVGNTDNSPMGAGVTSGNTAVPIWNTTMQAALAGRSPTSFAVPPGIELYQVCDYTGAIYSELACPNGAPLQEVAWNVQPPPPSAQGFVTTLNVDSFSGLIANEFCNEYVEQQSFINIDDPTAISWLQGNPDGQAWAQRHNIDFEASTPPTEACQPGQPRPVIRITAPQPNGEVGGLRDIRGTVTVPGTLASYEFQLASIAAPEDFSAPVERRTSPQPGNDAPLGLIDFNTVPNGNYILRLTVTTTDGGSAHLDIPIRVNNTNAAPAPQATPVLPQATTIPNGLPTLTPAPTLTPSTNTNLNPLQPLPPATQPGG